MKIAVAAKGGVGKTTVAGTLARALAASGKDVLAIDHDADSNLAVSLGLPREREIPAVPANIVERVETPEGETEWTLTDTPAEVIEEYGIRAPDGVILLRSRTVEADSGEFVLGHIAVTDVLSEGEDGREDVTIVDMPAGLEYFGVLNHVDAMLVVVEHATTALDTLRTMDLYARKEIGLTDVRVIANDVRSEDELAAIREFCAAHETDLDLAGVVPHDDAVHHAELEGVAPFDYAPDSPAVAAIEDLAEHLESTLGE